MERAAQREGCVAGRETEKHAGLHGSDRGSGEGSERGAQAKGEPRGHPGRRGCNNVPPPKSKMKKLGREKARRTAGTLLQPLVAPSRGHKPRAGHPRAESGAEPRLPPGGPGPAVGRPAGRTGPGGEGHGKGALLEEERCHSPGPGRQQCGTATGERRRGARVRQAWGCGHHPHRTSALGVGKMRTTHGSIPWDKGPGHCDGKGHKNQGSGSYHSGEGHLPSQGGGEVATAP